MYIAGIHLSNNHLTEGIVTSSVIAVIATQLIVGRKGLKEADEKGGPIKSMPTTLIGKLVTPIHAAAIVIPAVAYLTIVPLSGGVQPEIISHFSLPKFDLGETAINVLRLVGCAGLAATYKLFSASRSVLGQSFHHIGVSPHRSFHQSCDIIDSFVETGQGEAEDRLNWSIRCHSSSSVHVRQVPHAAQV